jgi:hypothetical protein
MAQQRPPQHGGQTGQSMGQQQMGTTGQQGQQGGYRLQDVQSPQEAATMNAITRAIEVCEWCADQCVAEGNANMAECIRLCEDVSELGESSQVLLSKKSNYSTQVLQTLEQAMQACAQECSRHNRAHCQDCASVLGQSLHAVQQLTRGGGMQQQRTGQIGQQMGGGQMGFQG